MAKQRVLKTFINVCTVTFKAFEYDVALNKNQTNLWHFTAQSKSNETTYLVMCAPELSQAKTLIKLTLNKVKEKQRLVVVTSTLTSVDIQAAQEQRYTIVTIQELKDYGDEMLKAREREALIDDKGVSFVDRVISHDNKL